MISLSLAWLLWRGAVGTRVLTRELFETPEVWSLALTQDIEQRVRQTLDERDRARGFQPGYLSDLIGALERETPERATIHVLGLRDLKQGASLEPVGNLCFPRRFRLELAAYEADWVPGAAETLLVFDPALHARLEPKVKLAEGPDWSLWR